MRILIAEGERYQADMLVRLLKHTGYTTDVVSDGQSCIEWAATGIYDVLILDMKIRGTDGFAVSETLRAQNNHIPILMLTANNILADRIRGLNNGVDYCLGKPFESAELLACLAAILRRCAVLLPSTLALFDLTLNPSSLVRGEIHSVKCKGNGDYAPSYHQFQPYFAKGDNSCQNMGL